MNAIEYGRFSDNKQDMERQARMFAEYTARNQLTVLATVLDPDVSGTIPMADRPGGRELFDLVRLHLRAGPLAVITTEQDRIGRDTLDIITTLRTIWSLGALPHFVAEGGAIPRTPENELRIEIRASVAQYEVRKIRQRIQSKLNGKRSAGELVGTLSYGWNVRYRFADGHELLRTDAALTRAEREKLEVQHGRVTTQLEENRDELKWILHMATQRALGRSYNAIANDLNVRQVPTKRGPVPMKVKRAGWQKLPPGERCEVRMSAGTWQFGHVQTILESRTVQDWLQRQAEAEKQAA